jgi:tRNA pseudouridine38-40 synthase
MAQAQNKTRTPGQNWKLTVAYDGTDYSGWQVQPRRRTIQGELADAVEQITRERVLPQGSGRTDAGVHALGQVASFSLRANIPPENLQRALNRILPADIRVVQAETAAENFHARHAAVRKTYEYRIFRGEICPPFLARYTFPLVWPLDLAAMQAAAACVIGEHDFTSFSATEPELTQRLNPEVAPPCPVRVLTASAWHLENDVLTYRVTGEGFLHHMVRNLVGTFIDIGRGQISADAIPQILAARERGAAGPTAPARGLFLISVEYAPAQSTDASC